MSDIRLKGVYYVASQNPNMNPVAIRPEVLSSGYAAWEDTSNGRTVRIGKVLFDGKEIKEDEEVQPDALPNDIEIIAADGQKYHLVKLTNQLFKDKLKPIVAGGQSLDFANDEELQEFYLKQHFS